MPVLQESNIHTYLQALLLARARQADYDPSSPQCIHVPHVPYMYPAWRRPLLSVHLLVGL